MSAITLRDAEAWARRFARRCTTGRDEDEIYVDVEDYVRKRELREAAFQQQVEASSKIQRVSGARPPTRRWVRG